MGETIWKIIIVVQVVIPVLLVSGSAFLDFLEDWQSGKSNQDS